MRTVLIVGFEDEVGKIRRIIIADPVEDVNPEKVRMFGKVIIESGAFSTKGRYKKVAYAEKVVTDTQTILDQR